MVTHRNLIENLEMIRRAFGNTQASTYVSWVPLYHDMGLILNALETLYVGSTCVLMSPAAFMQQPIAWLRAIHQYRAEVAGAPNFAFDLCAGRIRDEQLAEIDLSCWRVAFNGAEPVRADSLTRFAAKFAGYGFDAKAFYPCYGLAEATLLWSPAAGAAMVLLSGALRGMRCNGIKSPNRTMKLIDTFLSAAAAQLVGESIAIVDPEC